MQSLKRVLALLLAAALCAAFAPGVFAEPFGIETALLQLYGDGMLFQQEKPAILTGTAVGGSTVQCALVDDTGKTVAKGEGSVNKSNRFSVGFLAPRGGYARYTVELRLDGVLFRTLHDVVFGELWLASGQSNMDFPLGQSETGSIMQRDGQKGSPWLRFYQAPPYVRYNGDTELFPADPQRDIDGGVWLTGESDAVYGVSAVAFFFAQKLQKELDMPVGVLQSSLGGSSIYSWLSRESIEADAPTLAYLQQQDRYFPADTWQESGHNVYNDMTVNYNKKIAPLRVFRPSGMIWYQGETDIFCSVPPELYARAFDSMQRQCSALFGYAEGERLPIVYTQLVSFDYGKSALQQMNAQYAAMQAEQPNTRAVTPIYDVPMSYDHAAGAIHPSPKQPVGERMAYAAQGLVYGKNSATCSAPYPTRVEARDGSVYVTLSYAGNGLAAKGARLAGFSVTDASGVYVPAEAEIVGRDTVRVYSPAVAAPTAACYAFAQMNAIANLYATDDDGFAMPVSPFITDAEHLTQAWQSRDWAECDQAAVWQLINDTYTGYYDTWQAEHTKLISFAAVGVSGNALHMESDGAAQFTAQPVMRYEKDGKMRFFPDADRDYSRYSKMSFSVRNTGSTDIRLDAVRFYTSDLCWFAPAVDGTDDTGCVIPADGAWHTVTLDADTLFRRGSVCGATYSRAKLSEVKAIRLCFADPEKKGAQIDLDAFRFTPSAQAGHGVRFIPRFSAVRNVWDWFCAIGMLLLKPFSAR